MTDNIVNALLEGLFACLVFLDESPDDIVDPDSAVRTMAVPSAAAARTSVAQCTPR